MPRETRLHHSNQKDQGSRKFCRGAHPRSTPGGRPWDVEETVYHCDSAAVSGACSEEGPVSAQGPSRPRAAQKDAEAAVLRSSSAQQWKAVGFVATP